MPLRLHDVFIILIILGSTLPEETCQRCFDSYRVITSNAQFGVTITLLVFNTVLAFVVAGAMLALGIRLFIQLRMVSGKSGHLLIVALGGAICYFASSIIFIGVATQTPSPYQAWLLAAFEVVPCLFIIALVSWTPERRNFAGVHTNSLSKSSSETESHSHMAVSSWRV